MYTSHRLCSGLNSLDESAKTVVRHSRTQTYIVVAWYHQEACFPPIILLPSFQHETIPHTSLGFEQSPEARSSAQHVAVRGDVCLQRVTPESLVRASGMLAIGG